MATDSERGGSEPDLAEVFKNLYLEVVHLRAGLDPTEYIDETARCAGYADAALEGRERADRTIREAAEKTADDEAPEYGVERLPGSGTYTTDSERPNA